MDFTVIICTFNRAGNLQSCLEALAAQEDVEGRNWEVLVVDNNSSDNTASTVGELANKLPICIRYVHEPQQGLNYARNTGIRSSQGKYFSYVDDDILVSKCWLASLFKSFEDNDADAVGGRIHLDPSILLPAWIRPDTDMKGFLGYQDFGEEPQRLDGHKRYPFGGNMAFNRRVVERVGYFNPRLGRKGAGQKRSELFKGAETDFFNRLANYGEARIFYAPNAIVYHKVMPFQITKRYFRTIHFNAGFQKAYHDGTTYPTRWFGVPRFLYAQLIRAFGRYLLQVVTRGPNWAFRQQMNVAHMAGTILGFRSADDKGSEQT